jgi:DNA modification methylase
MVKAIINWMGLKKGDVLLDPFAGSGTALIESKVEARRSCFTIEISIRGSNRIVIMFWLD